MLAQPPAHTAEVVNFLDRLARFTVADRATLVSWQAYCQEFWMTIHRRLPDDPPEIGDFVSIYKGDDQWAFCGAARFGRFIQVWRARDGQDIGRFDTMSAALAAITLPAPMRKHR